MLTIEGGDVAVLAGAKADEDLVGHSDWDTRNFRDNGTSGGVLGRDGRRFASDGNSSSDGGGDAKQLCNGQ